MGSTVHRMQSSFRGANEAYQDILQKSYTVKRVDEVVRHRHLVTQDQNTQVSKKVFDILTENITINIELFRQTFTNVELLR